MKEGFGLVSKLAYQDFNLNHILNDIIEHDILIFVQNVTERKVSYLRWRADNIEVDDINEP
jgi:hypothetical protein